MNREKWSVSTAPGALLYFDSLAKAKKEAREWPDNGRIYEVHGYLNCGTYQSILRYYMNGYRLIKA
jgi:hypothetical protein